MKQQVPTYNNHIRIMSCFWLLFFIANMSCSYNSNHDNSGSVSDSTAEYTLGSIVNGKDTIEIKKSILYFNQTVSPRCSSRLWITVNGVTKGYYYVGGNDYDFYLKQKTIVCVSKENGVETTIDLSNGIPSNIFLISTFDKDSTAMGDFYSFVSE